MEIIHEKLKSLSCHFSYLKCINEVDEEGNPRYDDCDTYNWNALRESIEKHGIKNPLVLATNCGGIIDGNHRLAVAKSIYSLDKEVPCVYEDEDYWENLMVKKKRYEHTSDSKYRIIKKKYIG